MSIQLDAAASRKPIAPGNVVAEVPGQTSIRWTATVAAATPGRVVDFQHSPDGTAWTTVPDVPVTGGSVTFELAGLEPQTTRHGRFVERVRNWPPAASSTVATTSQADLVASVQVRGFNDQGAPSGGSDRYITDVRAGDLIAIVAVADSATAFVEGDCSLGGLVTQSANNGTHIVALFLHKATVSHSILAFTCRGSRVRTFNLGQAQLVAAQAGAYTGSGSANMPVVAAEADGLALYHTSNRASGTITLSPAAPAFDRAEPTNESHWGLTVRDHTLVRPTTGGSSPAQGYSVGSYSNCVHFVATFRPDADSGAAPAGVYKADSNGAGKARSSTVSSFQSGFVTFTLNRPAKIGHYVAGNFGKGDLWILKDAGALTIDGYTPGPTGSGASFRNGAMKNIQPQPSDGSAKQGFDGRAGSRDIPFDIGATASLPITLNAGDQIIVARSSAAAWGNGDAHVLEEWVILTVVDEVPDEDEFRPPYFWKAGAKPRYRRSQIDTSGWPARPHQGLPPLRAAMRRQVENISVVMRQTWQQYATVARWSMPFYGRDVGQLTCDGWAYLTSEATVAQKEPILLALAQHGIDVYGYAEAFNAFNGRGFYIADGGHGPGRLGSMAFAYKCFGEPGMLTALRWGGSGLDSNWSELSQTAYVTQDWITWSNTAGWDGRGAGAINTPFTAGMLNGGVYPMADYVGDGGLGAPASEINYRWDNAPNDYRNVGGLTALEGHILMMHALGLEEAVNYPAVFDYARRYFGLGWTGVDPWIDRGGLTPNSYVKPTDAPSNGTLPATYSGRMLKQYYDTDYALPWER